jgi:hypothetical protein
MAPAASEQKSLYIIELWAPWILRDEAEALVRHVHSLPFYERTPTARTLGNRLRLTNAERERLRLFTIKPFDMTDTQLDEQSKVRRRKRCERKRRDQGIRSRAAYLAEMEAKPKPWIAEGIDRATWYRRRAKAMRRGRGLAIVSKRGTHPVAVGQADSQKGFHEGVLTEAEEIVAEKVGETERTRSRLSALVTHPVAPESSGAVPSEWEARIAAMQNWGEKRRSKS